MRSRRIKLARVCLRQSTSVARKFDASGLHSEANSEVGDLLFSRISDRLEHALDTALSESSRYQQAVVTVKLFLTGTFAGFQALGLNPIHVQLQIVR